MVALWPLNSVRAAAEASTGDEEQIGVVVSRVRRAMASVQDVTGATVAVSGTEPQTFEQAYRTARGLLIVAPPQGAKTRRYAPDGAHVFLPRRA